ncbi:hypothetical protein ACKFRM_11795 [Corynebacterium sp. YSMAA1_1_D6]|uniref:hypothetical protein n=1 Tax=Corynebacterium sp. YSMAA1_1_D6 TaxID=3383589 RepID=UPI0038D1B30D
MPIASRLLKKCGLQPGDNAPDTQQCTKYFKKLRVSQPIILVKVYLHPIKHKVAAERASTQPPHNHHNTKENVDDDC